MSPFGLVGVSAAVVGGLIPGAAIGVALGRRQAAPPAGQAPPAPGSAAWRSPAVVALAVLALELLVGWALGAPVIGVSPYVLLVGRAAGRVDPRTRALGARLGLHPLGDVELPLVAAGVFGGAALGFGLQLALRAPLLVGVPVLVVCAFAALGLDLQHADALADAGATPGSPEPVLLPHLTAQEHLDALRLPAPEALRDGLQRRPRHLGAAERAALAGALEGAGG